MLKGVMNIFFPCYFINSVCTQNSKGDKSSEVVNILLCVYRRDTVNSSVSSSLRECQQKIIEHPSDRSFWMPELYISPGKDHELGAEHISLEKYHQIGWCSFASAHGGKWEGAVEGKKVLERKSCPETAPHQEIKTSVEIKRVVL